MSLDDFWHGDMRLLSAYQNAYLRNVEYTAWKQGNYNSIAFSVAMGNAFKKKGAASIEYPKWQDPIEKIERQKAFSQVTKDNIEQVFRNEQIKKQTWLHNILHNKKVRKD